VNQPPHPEPYIGPHQHQDNPPPQQSPHKRPHKNLPTHRLIHQRPRRPRPPQPKPIHQRPTPTLPLPTHRHRHPHMPIEHRRPRLRLRPMINLSERTRKHPLRLPHRKKLPTSLKRRQRMQVILPTPHRIRHLPRRNQRRPRRHVQMQPLPRHLLNPMHIMNLTHMRLPTQPTIRTRIRTTLNHLANHHTPPHDDDDTTSSNSYPDNPPQYKPTRTPRPHRARPRRRPALRKAAHEKKATKREALAQY
jgi:hypothetical protein